MSSIDGRPDHAELRELFERHLLPIAEAMRAQGRSFFPLGPDPELTTYLEDRRRPGTSAFEPCRWDDAAGLEAALRRVWGPSTAPELRELAAKMAELAQRLRATDEGGSGDVSELVYVMF